jgi:small subunit ribosomal protein S17
MSDTTDKAQGRGRRGTKVGVVVSNKAPKTVVVRVARLIQHPVYHRVVRRSSKFMAHNEGDVCRVGDTVEIVESRPLSARKRWRIRRVVRTAVSVEGSAS